MAKVIVLGAGVDSSIRIGMPLTNELIPLVSTKNFLVTSRLKIK